MIKFALFLAFFLPFSMKASPPEQVRKTYADQMYSAFQLQAMGNSTLAFFTFADAYRFALKNGESPAKLASIEALFQWYRKYGYSCGVAAESSRCVDEYISPNGYKKKTASYGSNLDPQQERLMRDFLFGVGQVTAGVFCLTVNAPIGGRFGTPLIVGGCKYMYDSVSAMIQDSIEKTQRLQELHSIEKKATASVEN